MTPRERWLAVLNHEHPDRTPMDYRATPEATRRLLDHLGCDLAEAFVRLHIDPVVTVGARYVGPPIPADRDVFGIGYAMTDYGTGCYRDAVEHPLSGYDSVEEIEADYTWPSPDLYDHSCIPSQVEGREECVIRGGASEPFATYKFLRGVERAYLT